MITFEKALELCGNKLIKREVYPVDTFDNAATWLLFDVGKDKTFEIIYNPSTLHVYIVCVKSCKHNYILTDDTYPYAYIEYIAGLDDTKYTVLNVDEDFEEKAYAIINDLPFDNRIKIGVELKEEEWLALAMAAHRLDITLNQYVEKVIERAIREEKANV